MATEKLAEGIRSFVKDLRALRALVAAPARALMATVPAAS